MKSIRPGTIVPSAALTVPSKSVRFYDPDLQQAPRVGDMVYGRVNYIGQHGSLENKHGRIHAINDGTRAIFVYGNRYAPDAFEGVVPERFSREVDILARSGVIGEMRIKNSAVKDPTKIEVLGYLVDANNGVVNTKNFPLARPQRPIDPKRKRSRMILHVGTSMNSGKSTSAMASCWALSAMGYDVRASKVTGTSSLKDILHMQDAGAEKVSDFSYLGYPSTYLLEPAELSALFRDLDGNFANNPSKYWVVEFADGILQRETAMLLRDEYVRSRFHRLVFSASDAFGAIGGLRILQEEFGLEADAVSGRCSSSPLMLRELKDWTEVPVFDNQARDLKLLGEILI